MAIDYDNLINWEFPEVEHTYTEKDAMLYALGIGMGADPVDTQQLDFLYENSPDFKVMPTLAVCLATPGFWVKEPGLGINWKALVQGEQIIEVHRPLPKTATVIGKFRIKDVIDKGEGRGALVINVREVFDKATGELLATCTSGSFCRADGGFGGPVREAPQPHTIPATEPEWFVDEATLARQALIYRLSGDWNPLHADPEIAKGVGFDRPILHGLCSLGIATQNILRHYCDYDVSQFKSVRARFSKPVMPGQTIRTETWRNGKVITFRARVVETGEIAVNNGEFLLA